MDDCYPSRQSRIFAVPFAPLLKTQSRKPSSSLWIFLPTCRLFKCKQENSRERARPTLIFLQRWVVQYWEVYTHTPFLRELLNPNGIHGQGPLFWIRFCQLLGLPESDVSHPAWRVVEWQKENVDIRIENHQLGKAIFIENKVYSAAHSGQLTNYFEIWKNQFPQGGAFVYLSIHGDMPDDAGFKKHKLYPKAAIIKELLTISYKHDIAGWVRDCLSAVEPLRLREILQQYLELIDYL